MAKYKSKTVSFGDGRTVKFTKPVSARRAAAAKPAKRVASPRVVDDGWEGMSSDPVHGEPYNAKANAALKSKRAK